VQGYPNLMAIAAAEMPKNPATGNSAVTAGGAQQVLGMLDSMLSTFEENLKNAATHEAHQVTLFKDLDASKKEAIKSTQASLVTKKTQLAHTLSSSGDAKEELLEVRKSVVSQAQYVGELKTQCENYDADYEARSTSRSDEITSLTEALTLLEAKQAEMVAEAQAQAGGAPEAGGGDGFLLHGSHRLGAGSSGAERKGTVTIKLAHDGNRHAQKKKSPKAVLDAYIRDNRPIRQREIKKAVTTGASAAMVFIQLYHPRPIRSHKNLAAIAAHVHDFQGIDLVIKKVNDMVATLQEEKAMEGKLRDVCVEEEHKIGISLEKMYKDQERGTVLFTDMNGKKSEWAKAVKEKTEQVETIRAEQEKSKTELEKKQQTFRDTVQKQRDAQAVFQEALSILKSFYSKKEPETGKVFYQQGPPAGEMLPPMESPTAGPLKTLTDATRPPKTFKAHKKHAGGRGIMGLLQMMYDEAKTVIDEVMKAEAGAQQAYESEMGNTTRMIEDIDREIMLMKKKAGDAEAAIVDMKEASKELLKEIEYLTTFKGTVMSKCSFVVTHFTSNQHRRDEEIASLRTVETVLKGATQARELESTE